MNAKACHVHRAVLYLRQLPASSVGLSKRQELEICELTAVEAWSESGPEICECSAINLIH